MSGLFTRASWSGRSGIVSRIFLDSRRIFKPFLVRFYYLSLSKDYRVAFLESWCAKILLPFYHLWGPLRFVIYSASGFIVDFSLMASLNSLDHPRLFVIRAFSSALLNSSVDAFLFIPYTPCYIINFLMVTRLC